MVFHLLMNILLESSAVVCVFVFYLDNIWAPSDELQNEHEMSQSIMSRTINMLTSRRVVHETCLRNSKRQTKSIVFPNRLMFSIHWAQSSNLIWKSRFICSFAFASPLLGWHNEKTQGNCWTRPRGGCLSPPQKTFEGGGGCLSPPQGGCLSPPK